MAELNKCSRCGSDLDHDGLCSDETCPFSDHEQTCMVGWAGHPTRDPFPNDGIGPCTVCTCGATTIRGENSDDNDDETEDAADDDMLPVRPDSEIFVVLKEIRGLVDHGLFACNSQYVHRDSAGNVLTECPEDHGFECGDCSLRRQIIKLVDTEYRKTWAATDWCVEDVLREAEENEIPCTREEAEALIEFEEEDIQEAQQEAGFRRIKHALLRLDREREDELEDEDEEESAPEEDEA